MKRGVPLFVGAALLAPAAGLGDEIEDQIATALEYYQAGDVGDAITELQFTIGAMQAQLAEGYAAAFPEPLDGWTADPVETEAGAAFMGGGTMLTRTYRKVSEDTDTGTRISTQLMIDNPMIQTMAAMMANPALIAMQPGAERLKVGRENAMLTFDEANQSGEVTLVLGGRVMLKLDGRALPSKDPMIELVQAFDIATLKSIAGLQ